jgi:hypothetical protein
MDSPLHYQDLIHRAATVDEVAEILRRFFASMTPDELGLLPEAVQMISTFSERGLKRKAALAAADGGHHASAAARLLATAVMRVEVLQMDVSRRRRSLLRWWRR